MAENRSPLMYAPFAGSVPPKGLFENRDCAGRIDQFPPPITAVTNIVDRTKLWYDPFDDVTDSSVTWPDNHTEIPFGTITLTARVDDHEPERRKIIFDPIPRIAGIELSGDPLSELRAEVYLLSGRRRRAALGDGKH